MSDAVRALMSEAIGRELVRDVAETLAAVGVPVMPLKGVWLQACVLREPGLRVVTDVDLLVPEERFSAAVARLHARRWRTERVDASEQTLVHADYQLPLDLHRRLFAPAAFRIDTRGLFARGSDDEAAFGARVRLPDPSDVIAHLIGHFAKMRGEASDTQVERDLLAIARRFAIAPERCASHLHACGMSRATRFACATLAGLSGEDFYRRLVAALPRDVTGTWLVAASRGLCELVPRHAALRALPGFLLERSLLAGVGALVARVRHRPRRFPPAAL